jgi:phosphoglycerol transferase MdoB-like AlkP superfamily enzyme
MASPFFPFRPDGALAVEGGAAIGWPRTLLIFGPHLVALAIMYATEPDVWSCFAFLLAWGLLNFFWMVMLRRPGLSGLLSLGLTIGLILASRLKHDVVQMTANFVDLMMIDSSTISFLLTIFPRLRWSLLLSILLAIPVAVLLWRLDPFRIRRLTAATVGLGFLASLAGLSTVWPNEAWQGYFDDGYVSKFARSGVNAISDYVSDGFMESDPVVAERLRLPLEESCHPAGRRPHIIMIHDESSFDMRIAPSVKLPAGYGDHFRSYDGKQRTFVVEGNGGPSWFTEYNVLAGLSSRSYRRFAYFVTRIAAGRVERGLPLALRRCGYSTVSLYPALGGFMSAKSFQMTTGIERVLDAKELGAKAIEPDSFFYNRALNEFAQQKPTAPLFMFLYLSANHFPWDFSFRPELSPSWRSLGNAPNVDEYLRRQMVSARDYQSFLAQIKRRFPGEPFLIVRYGDHQPEFSSTVIEPALDEAGIARRLLAYDKRYYSTYYAIDAVNFKPVASDSAMETIDAAYLPVVIQEAAGLPLDPSFAEQKSIMLRCNGEFYACKEGAEARRFNRMLIDAGYIKGL